MLVNPLEWLSSFVNIIFNFDVLRGFVITMWSYFLQSTFVRFFVTGTLFLVAATILCSGLVVFLPRLLEDYVRLYNWYLNSDFYDLFARKVNVRPIIVVLSLPVVMALGLVFGLTNLVVSTSYRLVFKVMGLRCFHCGHSMRFEERDLQCEHCATRYSGPVNSSCPLCGFKPNAVACPSCSNLVFIGLDGAPPNPNLVS